MARITPLIMCGGAGTRLWPASRVSAPKQFINLFGTQSTFQDTIARVSDPELFAQPVVVTGHDYRHMVADQLSVIGAEASILLEPSRRDSGPAIAAGAHFIAEDDPEALVMVLAADHVVGDVEAFRAAARKAAASAQTGRIVTFGVRPDYPATGYGYIRPGEESAVPGVLELSAFVEKPDAARAEEYVAAGYLWNSGNFLFRADTLLAEYAKLDQETVEAAAQSVAGSTRDLGFIVLDAPSFNKTKAMSIDFAVMEKTKAACVVPVSMAWSDVGSWHAVWELTEKDEEGNAARGDAVFLDAQNNYVSAEDLVCLVGVSNLAVVQTRDATLVFDRSKGEAVRSLVAELKSRGRNEVDDHTQVFRPWGSYQGIDHGDRFQVKRIVVKPGGKLSLQKHFHRAEHWVVVRGAALVTVGNEEKLVRENESTFIPLGALHRLENPGKIPLELIEVQSGSYLGEDDIVRLEDVYNRT
ncbi:mannose-1-phosphate guanylyltransferase/mannose-6-phosphate isomerase [Afifella sp. IM 167]|uniref:mannose-1-phosphate guanylyltransferase/mannose-6-phosphate isomerase n=1 Tax=Afifella sp. IM 167 TaxID=2033586 RepID=UPI001CCEA8E8|nr:mannose-1-phosphate guanylyltransferase/mannose-6-phosphate isomerase [Afifella sp. IM 167]MBZ8134264.1 mannose-1-phosphate guanylyltransferase/mannose-6-phosphate isomerase [Afifella sp. IM 167]